MENGFRLNKAQIEWIEAELKRIKEILKHEPKLGWGMLKIKLNIFDLLIGLHNAGFDKGSETGPGSGKASGNDQRTKT